MKIIIPQVWLEIRKEPIMDILECFGAVRGATMHRIAVLLFASTAIPVAATAITASVLLRVGAIFKRSRGTFALGVHEQKRIILYEYLVYSYNRYLILIQHKKRLLQCRILKR